MCALSSSCLFIVCAFSFGVVCVLIGRSSGNRQLGLAHSYLSTYLNRACCNLWSILERCFPFWGIQPLRLYPLHRRDSHKRGSGIPLRGALLRSSRSLSYLRRCVWVTPKNPRRLAEGDVGWGGTSSNYPKTPESHRRYTSLTPRFSRPTNPHSGVG